MSKSLPIPTAAILFCCLFAMLIGAVQPASAITAVLSWDPPTTNMDGTVITDLAGFKLYVGSASRNYSTSFLVGLATNGAVSNLTEGATYFFAATALNAAGRESDFSEEFVWTAPDLTPPVIAGVSNRAAAAGADGKAAVSDFIASATISDNLSPRAAITVSQTPAAGTRVGLGDTSVKIVAADQAGNSATSSVKFTVVDQTPPTVACASPVTLTADANGRAAIPNLVSQATVGDNCSSASQITVTQQPVAGTVVGVGTNLVTLTARDPAGNQASCTVAVIVKAANKAPVCNAGADQTIQLPTDTVTLNATASDDGLPEGSALTYNWSKVSGPSAVAFANPRALKTTATFAGDGTYVLRLTVSDAQYSVSDEVTVVVKPAKKPAAPQKVRIVGSSK